MGHKVYTKTGDEGKTSLIGGKRVKKHHPRLEAYGTIDELNSYIGLIRSYGISEKDKSVLIVIQNKLFTIGGILAIDDDESEYKSKFVCDSADVLFLEKEIDEIDKYLPELKTFVLPGGHPLISFTHIARTICRRSERRISELSEEVEVSEFLRSYINRLSDYLFVLSRKFGIEHKIDEVSWEI